MIKGSMTVLAQMLAQYVGTGKPVLDQTGLKGDFNLTVEYDSSGSVRAVMATVLEEKAGLKLTAATVPIDVIVIDNIERPASQ